MVWVEVRLEKRKKLAVGVVYISPEDVRVENTEKQFEWMQEEIVRLQKGFSVLLKGNSNAHIGLGEEESQNRNGQKVANFIWTCRLRFGNELCECTGRWSWECGEKKHRHVEDDLGECGDKKHHHS